MRHRRSVAVSRRNNVAKQAYCYTIAWYSPFLPMKRFALAAACIALAGCNMGASTDTEMEMDDTMDNGAMEMDAGADVMVK